MFGKMTNLTLTYVNLDVFKGINTTYFLFLKVAFRLVELII